MPVANFRALGLSWKPVLHMRVRSMLLSDPTVGELGTASLAAVWCMVFLIATCIHCSQANFRYWKWAPGWAVSLFFGTYALLAVRAWWTQAYRWRRTLMQAGTAIWWGVAGSLVAGNPASTAYVYFVAGFAAMLASLQIKARRDNG